MVVLNKEVVRRQEEHNSIAVLEADGARRLPDGSAPRPDRHGAAARARGVRGARVPSRILRTFPTAS